MITKTTASLFLIGVCILACGNKAYSMENQIEPNDQTKGIEETIKQNAYSSSLVQFNFFGYKVIDSDRLTYLYDNSSQIEKNNAILRGYGLVDKDNNIPPLVKQVALSCIIPNDEGGFKWNFPPTKQSE